MRRSDIQLGKRHRWLLYGASALMFASGVLWWLLERFGQLPSEFGPVKNPAQYPTLIVHGVAALGYLLLLGGLTTVHMRRGWTVKKQRLQASLLVALQSLLVLSAAGLYYVGHDGVRSVISDTHLVAGLLLGAMLPLHIWLGRRVRKAVVHKPMP